MAENIIKRALNAILSKSITPFNNTSNGYNLDIMESYFSWILGAGGQFSKYTKSYGENPLVYMVVNKIAVISSSMKRIVTDLNGEIIENSVIEELLKSPNYDDDDLEFRQKIAELLLLTGNAFIKMTRGEGAGFELEVLFTQRIDIICNNLGDVVSYKYTKPDGSYTFYELEDILHIKTSNVVNIDGTKVKYGLSPLQSAWIVVSSSMEKFKADASIFKSRGIIGILTSDGDTPMLEPEREKLQDSFDHKTGGAEKYNKIHVTSSRLKFLQTGMSPTDLKLLEGILSSLRLIAGLYGMPSVLFNDNDSSTYNNISEAKITAYTDVYIPLAEKIDKELSKWLGEALGVEEIIKIDRKSINVLKSSTNNVSQSLNNAPTNVAQRATEAMTINEVREHILELEPIGTIEGAKLMGKGTDSKEKTDGQENQ